MKRRLVITCIVIAVTATAVLAGYRVYLHQRIKSEIARIKSSRQERAEAAYLVSKLGRAAVPHLVVLLSDEDPYVRYAAADALGYIGAPAKSTVPAIVEMLKEREQTGRAAFEREGYRIALLGRIGPDAEAAVPFLSGLLDYQSSLVRVYAAEALWKISRHARAIPTLVEVIQDKDLGMGGGRMEASGTLEAIGPDAKAAVPALIEALTDDCFGGYAARALSAIGPSPHEIPAILQALAKVQTPSRRDGIIAVLDKIGVEPEELVRRHVAAIRQEDPAGSIWATGFLLKAGPDDVAAVPALTQALGDENADVRAWAASTLIKISPVAKLAIPALVEAENDTEEQVRSAAVMTLDVIRREPSPTERPRPAIDTRSRVSPRIVWWISLAAVVVGIVFVYGFSLSRRRPWFRMKRTDLVLLLLILIVGVPSFYRWHLATIREFPFSLGPAPFLLKYGVPSVRHATLSRFETPVSLDVWAFRDSASRHNAISALISKVNLYPSGKWLDKTILAILIEALRDDNGGVRKIAAEALGRFEAEANEAIPALTVALQDWSACEAAAMALRNIRSARPADDHKR